MFTQKAETMLGMILLGTLAACTNVTLSDDDYARLVEDLRAASHVPAPGSVCVCDEGKVSMKKRSNSIMGRIICMPATSESVPYNLTKRIDFVNLMAILYIYEALTQLPLLVACEFIIRGAWRANSETGRMVSFFVLIPDSPNSLHSSRHLCSLRRFP